MENLTLSGIVLAHHFIAPPGWVSDEYAFARQHHGIVYVLSGAAEYRMGSGETLQVRAGDCLYVPRGTVYVTRCSGAEDFVHMTVNFDIAGSGRLFLCLPGCGFIPPPALSSCSPRWCGTGRPGIPITGSGAWGCCTKWPT